MLERRLSVRELKDREILIGILKDTLPNLTEDERNTVCRTIIRMKNEIEEVCRLGLPGRIVCTTHQEIKEAMKVVR